MEIGPFKMDIPFIVVPRLNRPIIIGYDWFKQYRAKIDCHKEVLQIIMGDRNVELAMSKETTEKCRIEVGFLET